MTTNNNNANNKYWGLGATIVFSLFILLTFIITQTVAFILYAKSQFIHHPATNEIHLMHHLEHHGYHGCECLSFQFFHFSCRSKESHSHYAPLRGPVNGA